MLRERNTMLCYTAFVSRVSFCFWRRKNFIANAIHTTASLERRIIWRFLRIKVALSEDGRSQGCLFWYTFGLLRIRTLHLN